MFSNIIMPAPTLSLQANEIHLWRVEPKKIVSSDQTLLAQYQALLTDEEYQKQQRYKFAPDRHNALITRAFVRDLLSYYANIAPEQWRFEKGEKGKPELINAPIPLKFNLSHTKNMIICTVTLNDDIGCDVENTTRTNDVLVIADRYFSKKETSALFTLPKSEQHSRFFDYWTLKESYIKACGLGLTIPLKDFSFTINKRLTESQFFNEKIQLSFAPQRQDIPNLWRSWLFYPSEEHRIAISIKAKKNNQYTPYRYRFFNSIPLVSVTEVSIPVP